MLICKNALSQDFAKSAPELILASQQIDPLFSFGLQIREEDGCMCPKQMDCRADEAIALRDQDLLHFGDSKLRVQVCNLPATAF